MRQWKRNGPLALALGCVVVLAFSGVGFAQAESPKEASAQEAKIIALEKEFNEQMMAARKAYNAAETQEEGLKVWQELSPNTGDFSEEFLAVANEDPASDAGFRAAKWVVENAGPTPAGGAAVKIMMKHHADRDSLDTLCQRLAYSQSDNAQKLMAHLSDKSPHRNVRGQATFYLAQNIIYRDSGDTAQQARAERLFEQVVAEYGDLKGRRGTLADLAPDYLFEVRNLAIGKVAPEIEGQDGDGVDFKLTDYRGKVVVIDFWGDW